MRMLKHATRPRIIVAALLAAAALLPAIAWGNDGTEGNGLSWCDEMYLDLYAEVDPDGPNILKEGLPDGSEATEGRICRKVKVLDRIREQEAAEAVLATQTVPTPTEAAAPTTSSGGYAIPEYIVQCESGGDYNAVNPTSGAYGAYQVLPSTASAYGCDLSTPAGQDACAAEIYAAEGASPWSCG